MACLLLGIMLFGKKNGTCIILRLIKKMDIKKLENKDTSGTDLS